ncbi:uncharacterized protein PGRI_046420 [Penicillium griseofulvum]|uniref:Mid2 domain-containing protein n=1 Tax=Penicillium patulum TaxID=5078 RepID=A0A135L9Z6_PENPA|nr:uncharacterized protein PGRI_046420 [Penicillium griseofulvum]KXG45786.1 hypothetical protein PGRI_046420 [Penicillium griseofulvum]
MKVKMVFPLLFVLLSGFISTVNGEKTNYMINPVYDHGKSPVWTLGDQKVIEWKTDLPVYNISIWQESPSGKGAYNGGNVFAQINEKDRVSNFTWTVQLYSFDLDYSPTFLFWVNYGGSVDFTSAYFNITRKSSTESTESTETTSLTRAPSSSPTSSSDQQTISPTDQPTGLSMTAKIALGVGIGIGIPILAAMAALVWLRARQLKATQLAAAGVPVSHGTNMQQHQAPNMNIGEMHGTDPAGFCPELPQDANGKPLRTELPDRRYE